jgi:hypothetical protein
MLPGRRDAEGRLHITPDPILPTTTFQGGIAINPLGQVHTVSGAPDHFVNGFGVSDKGALCIGDGGGIHAYLEGIPRTLAGKVTTQTDVAPAATDPFLGGLRIGLLGGVYVTTLPPT